MSKSAHPGVSHFDSPAKNAFVARRATARVLAFDRSHTEHLDSKSSNWLCADSHQRFEDNIEVKKIPFPVTLVSLGVVCGGFWALVALALSHL